MPGENTAHDLATSGLWQAVSELNLVREASGPICFRTQAVSSFFSSSVFSRRF